MVVSATLIKFKAKKQRTKHSKGNLRARSSSPPGSRSVMAFVCGRKGFPLPDDLENVSDKLKRHVKRMNKTQLQEFLVRLGLPSEGKVPELKERILGHYAAKEKSTADTESTTVEANVPFSSKRKKKWTVTDPAEIAPHYYHKDLFRANFPLVDVVEIPKGYPFPVRDKFGAAVLDDMVTYEARRKWIRRLFSVSQDYKVPENEKQAFPLHFAFLEPLKEFTRPSRGEVEKQNRYSAVKRKWRYEDVKMLGRPKLRKVEEEEHEGFYIVPDNDDVPELLGPNRSDGDYSGLELSAEEALKLEGDLRENADIPTGFADGVIHIFDERVLDYHPISMGGNPDRVAGVLEHKFEEDGLKWNARFQGGFYTVKHSLDNIQKGHGVPIYVLVMTASTWSYGIMVPEGYVQICNGSVEPRSMDEFRRHQAMTQVCTMDYDKLGHKLKSGTEFYRRNYREKPNAVYRDGPMLVGQFYLCSEWFNLPRAVNGGSKDEGGCRLFDGLMRLVIGDSVMDLTKEELEERIKLRKEMLEEQLDSWFE